MNYQELEQQIKQKTESRRYNSWRGDLSSKGLRETNWGDLSELDKKEKTN